VEVAALTALLAPFLASFLKGGQAALETAAERGGDAAVQYAGRLWDRLRGKVAETPDAVRAAEKLADKPDSGLRRKAMTKQLEALLAEDPQLAEEVAALLAQAQDAGVKIITASGDRSLAFEGDVSDSVIILGDDVSVEQ
jgi:beta-phosphoglucomutase-like phosphatase (HAD superfamily)